MFSVKCSSSRYFFRSVTPKTRPRSVLWGRKCFAPEIGYGLKGGQVGCFQRHRQVFVINQEQRQIRQHIAHTDGLDERLRQRTGDVRRARQRPGRIEPKRVVVAPEKRMNSLRITPCGREQIDQGKVNAGFQ
jgi:hypothetical protein